MQIPGFGSDEVKQSGVGSGQARKSHLPGYQARLAAVREAKGGGASK